MNNVNFFEEEMYHMFDASGISNDIAYIKNSISYPDFLINFIDETKKLYFVGEIIPIDFPQIIKEYQRSESLELWKISLFQMT